MTDSFWSGNEQLAWRIGNNDLYNMFPDIILYFPLYNNQSLQFGVKVPPQVSHVIPVICVYYLLSISILPNIVEKLIVVH